MSEYKVSCVKCGGTEVCDDYEEVKAATWGGCFKMGGFLCEHCSESAEEGIDFHVLPMKKYKNKSYPYKRI